MITDLTVLSRLTQTVTREGTSVFIRTWDGTTLVNAQELTNYPVGPIPDEVAIIAQHILGSIAVPGGAATPVIVSVGDGSVTFQG